MSIGRSGFQINRTSGSGSDSFRGSFGFRIKKKEIISTVSRKFTAPLQAGFFLWIQASANSDTPGGFLGQWPMQPVPDKPDFAAN